LHCEYFTVICLMYSVFFFIYSYTSYRHLHSFPTRRSSDLAEIMRHMFGLNQIDVINGDTPIPRRQEIVNRFQYHIKTDGGFDMLDRKSTRLNSSHVKISYAVFCLKKKYKD